MSFTPVRKDFVFDTRCSAPKCPHELKSNVATFLRDEHGKELPFGPTCARNRLDEEGLRQLRRIPDFTKAAAGQEREGGAGGGAGGGANDEEAIRARQTARAVTYLLLRQDRLAHIPEAGYSGFAGYMETYRATGMLPDDAVRHILNVERSQGGKKYGFDNLQTVYAYDRCLERAISALKEDKRAFLMKIQQGLRKYLRLTEGQVQAAEKWFENIHGHKPLDPSGFASRSA